MNSLLLLFVALGVPTLGVLVYALVTGSPGLRRHVLTRVALTIPMILILATVVFVVLRVLPGDPVTSSLGPRGNPEVREAMRDQLGLDLPIWAQYGRYLGSLFTFDLGNALTSGRRPVAVELGERFPATIELIVPAAIVAVVGGILAGTLAGSRRKSATDYGLRMFSVAIYAMPVFWLGLILQLIFAVQLGWFPVAGRIDPIVSGSLERVTNLLVVDSLITGNWAALGSALRHLVLPAATLGLILLGVFLRLTRVNVIETLQEDYVAAARARGIKEGVIVYRHALRNAMIPVITFIGLQVAILLAGAVLTETVFSWPGVGRYLVERIGLRDYTAVQGVVAVFAIFVSMISLLVDVVYSIVDPRVRY
ncbi:MAG: ABC transporter permease [Acidimicrobiales bacterium]|nr:ABC transporter permease [Acidimicrobiales bacterium]HLV89758.1 ABC transporter permease [Acidimicrobiia bacterium]